MMFEDDGENGNRNTYIPFPGITKGKKAKKSGSGAKAAAGKADGKLKYLKYGMIAGIVFILFFSLVIGGTASVIPFGDIFYSAEDMEDKENEIEKLLREPYLDSLRDAEPYIYEYIKETYPEVSISEADIVSSWNEGIPGYWIYIPPTYEHPYGLDLKAGFWPDTEYIKQNVSAYINAVNGVIAYLGSDMTDEISMVNEDENNIRTFDGKILESERDESGKITFSITDEAKDFISSVSDSETDSENEEYLDLITDFSDDFFVPDDKSERWEHEGKRLEDRGKVRSSYRVCETVYKGSTQEERCEYLYKDAYCYCEEVTIFVYYSLSGFRQDDLDACMENADTLRETQLSGTNGYDLVYGSLDDFYNSYISAFEGSLDFKSEDFGYSLDPEKHSRDYIFRKLLEDGTLMYVPIFGLPEYMVSDTVLIYGESEIPGISSSDGDIWDELRKLIAEGKLSPGTEKIGQCTGYVQYVMYLKYGIAYIWSGNGRDYADVLVAASGDFYKDNKPKAGGIFSSGAGTYGHTGYIENVYEKDGVTYVTVSEANYYGKGAVTTTDMTLTDLYMRSHGRITFANPV